MKDEIEYCSYNMWECGEQLNKLHCDSCLHKHRKWPTPEQFFEEYGEVYPDDGAVWFNFSGTFDSGWDINFKLGIYADAKKEQDANKEREYNIICACTPWGKPPNNWRP